MFSNFEFQRQLSPKTLVVFHTKNGKVEIKILCQKLIYKIFKDFKFIFQIEIIFNLIDQLFSSDVIG